MTRTHLCITLGLVTILTTAGVGSWYGVALAGSGAVQAQGVLGASSSDSQVAPLAYPVQTGGPSVPNIQARYFAVYNPESGKLLAGKDENVPVPIASTTKMMNTFIIARIGKVDDVITVSQEAGTQPGSLMNLRPGEKMTVHDLLRGALMVSGNDAAMALGEYGGGILLNDPSASHDAKVARFVQEMNTMAATLGMSNTAYKDPAGLNDDGHSSALDLAKLTAHTIENPIIKEIIGTANTTVWNTDQTIRHDLRNSNKLVADYFYDGVIGGKTGFTPAAGHCLISAAQRGNLRLIVVALNTYSLSLNASADAVKAGLDWGFANWTLQ
jgi:D-alanyl-D-alanine carboxypeptidase (penicillin-binding protein 5/6)